MGVWKRLVGKIKTKDKDPSPFNGVLKTQEGPGSLPQNGTKKDFPTDIPSLLKALDSSDPKTSGRAAEALYNAALEDSAVCRAVCAKHLPRASALLSSSSAATQMFSAYLISALAGTSPSINRELSRLQVASTLASGLAATHSTGVSRGMLRALSKLAGPSASPEDTVDQLVAARGLATLASRLGSQDLGIVRRCLDLLTVAARLRPDPAVDALLGQKAAVGALLGLLRSTVMDVQAGAMTTMQVLAEVEEARHALLDKGALEGLAFVTDTSSVAELRMQANATLQALQPQALVMSAGGTTAAQSGLYDSALLPGMHRAAEIRQAPESTPSPSGVVPADQGSASAATSADSAAADRGPWEAHAPRFLATRHPIFAIAEGVHSESDRSAMEGPDALGPDTSRDVEDFFADHQDWLVADADIELCRDGRGRPIKLGEGGFGIVYKGLAHGVDEVAVKRIRAEQPSPAQIKVFRDEINCLRRLNHRNIVQFYGASMLPEAFFLVTEMMTGGDLYGALRRHPELLAWDKLGRKVALDVALGLHYLQSRRPPVLHRDLKSPNILLTGEGVAKIADVGMSRRMVSDLATAQPIMTPLWSAPEVLRRERVSAKADMWSYGVLVWEIVTGQDITKFQPLALTRVSEQSGKRAVQPSEAGNEAGTELTLGEDAPAMARHIFQQCTHLSPALRPSATQVIEWLRSDM
ncbi:hypothetical protein ACKKBG_A29590 [Auxenochlorella protothecoides x Auxenochlorella symbiontica]